MGPNMKTCDLPTKLRQLLKSTHSEHAEGKVVAREIMVYSGVS